MKIKNYDNIMVNVAYSKIDETLKHYGSDGYKLVSVIQSGIYYLLFFTKEHIEHD